MFRRTLWIAALVFLGACHDGAPQPFAPVDGGSDADGVSDAPSDGSGGEDIGDDADAEPGDTGGDAADVIEDSDGGDGAVADTGDATDSGDDADAADGGSEIPEDPLPAHTALPHDVFVHVTDPSGTPLANAQVTLDGRGARSDFDGDASFVRLLPGRYRLAVAYPGTATSFWQVEIPHLSPLEVEIPHLHERRYSVSMAPHQDGGAFVSGVGAVRNIGPIAVQVSPASLVDLDASAFTGIARVTGTSLTAARPEDTFGSGLAATTDDGTAVQLDPIVALDLQLVDDASGLPLQPSIGAPLTVAFPAPAGASEGESVSAWVLEPLSGGWVEDPDTVGTVNAAGFVEVEIPHLSRWAFGPAVRRGSSCVRVQLPGIANYTDAMLHVRIGGTTTQLPVFDEQVDLFDVPPSGVVGLAVYVGGVRMASDERTPVPQSDADDGACAEMDDPAMLDLPEPFGLGSGPGRIRAHVQAGVCPPSLAEFSLSGPGGTFRNTMQSSTLLVDGLDAGTWTLTLLDPDTGAALVTREFEVDDCGESECERVELRLDLGADRAQYTKGGCARSRACVGDECSSCVAVFVSGTDGVGLGDRTIALYDPVDEVLTTDSAGDLCVDVPAGAGSEILVLARGAELASASLRAETSCDAGDCARLPLVIGGARSECTLDRVLVGARAFSAGLFDPGYLASEAFPAASAVFASALVVAVTSGSGPLADALGAGVRLRDQTFAFRGREELITGAEAETWIHYRTRLTADLGLDIKIEPEALRGGARLDLSAGELHVSLVDLRAGSSDGYSSTSGTGRVVSVGDGSALVRFEGEFRNDDTTVGLRGYAFARLTTEADTAPSFANLDSHLINGAIASVTWPSHPDGLPDAVSGHVAPVASPMGQLAMCLPRDVSFMLTGEAIAGQLRPFTPLMAANTAGDLLLVGNPDPDAAAAFASTDLHWADESLVARLYRAVGGHSTHEMYESGTIIGRALVVGGSLGDFQRVFLTHPTFGEIDGAKLDEQMNTATTGEFFAFPGVPPVAFDDPYTLHIVATDGREVTAFQRQLAPIAGGVAYLLR